MNFITNLPVQNLANQLEDLFALQSEYFTLSECSNMQD